MLPAIATTLLLSAGVYGQCRYDITAVITDPCQYLSPFGAHDMNNSTEVVGFIACGGGSNRGWVWDGEFTVIDTPAETTTLEGISDTGYLCGYMRPPGADSSGFTVIEDQLAFLPLPKGMNNARALSINDLGVAVGWWGNFITGDPVAREAFVWPRDGEAFGLNQVLGVTLSQARDINDCGVVVGAVDAMEEQRAFIYDRGRARVLPPIPGGLSSNALGVNELGDVVGDGRLPPSMPGMIDHAGFVYIDGSFDVIEAPRQFNRASAKDINRFRQVVGSFRHSAGATTSATFIWQHGAMVLLADLITEPLPLPGNTPCCINDLGQIVISNRSPRDIFEPAKLVLTPRDRPVGDIDIDCRVDQHDLAFLLGRWGCPDQAADLDHDGVVGFADLMILLAQWRPDLLET